MTALGALLGLLFLVCAPAALSDEQTGEPTAAPQPRILVIGGLLTNPEKAGEIFQPMANYVKSHMADLGVIDVVVVTANDREHLARLVRFGRVDWVSQTAYNATYFMQQARMDLLARSWRDGSPTYRSVFFVRKDSKLETLADLNNHVIAFEHPYSTSAYFVPIVELEARGARTFMMSSPAGRAPEGQVAYTFSRSEYNTALWVHKGIVDAGVFSNANWKNPDIVPRNFVNEFRVLHETGEFVRALELVRSDLDEDIKERLRGLLQRVHEDPGAAELLKAYFNTQRFDQPTSEDIDTLSVLATAESVAEVPMEVQE